LISERNPGKGEIEIEQLFWKDEASDDFINRLVKTESYEVISQLSALIRDFVNAGLSVEFATLDFDFPFEKQLIVVGTKLGYSAKVLLKPINSYLESRCRKKHEVSIESFQNYVYDINRQAREDGYYDYLDEDEPRYQEHFESLAKTKKPVSDKTKK